MISPSDVSAVIVTKGDHPVAPVVESLAECAEVVVYDNSVETDLAVYGRYAAIARCERDVILVVDDDVLLPPESVRALCADYEPGVLSANMPQIFRKFYDGHCLVGFGAVFDRYLPTMALGRFANHFGIDSFLKAADSDLGFFHRTCDIVFTALTPRNLVDVLYTNREFASDPDRMHKTEGYIDERKRMLDLVRRVA